MQLHFAMQRWEKWAAQLSNQNLNQRATAIQIYSVGLSIFYLIIYIASCHNCHSYSALHNWGCLPMSLDVLVHCEYHWSQTFCIVSSKVLSPSRIIHSLNGTFTSHPAYTWLAPGEHWLPDNLAPRDLTRSTTAIHRDIRGFSDIIAVHSSFLSVTTLA